MSDARIALVACGLTAMFRPERCLANGRFPSAQHVVVGPGTASTSIALRTTFGFAVSDDGGASFHWICEDALNYSGSLDPPFALDSAGSLRLGLFDGVITASRDRCAFVRDPALQNQFVADLDSTRSGAITLAVTSSGSPTARNGVYRSDTGGTFSALGMGVTGVLFSTLEMAPSDPMRVYLAGVTLALPQRAVFYRSDDGGVSLSELPFAPGGAALDAYVAGVSPVDSNVVFVRSTLPAPDDASSRSTATALLRSLDGGTTWSELARTPDGMAGFAIADDGQTVWYGSPTVGLFRSSDGGTTFRSIGAQRVGCLRYHAGSLYLCGNFVTDQYALAVSRDLGNQFVSVLGFSALMGPFACGAGSPEQALCAPRWPNVRATLSPGGMDGGSSESQTRPGSCGCGVRGGRGRAGSMGAVLALGILLGEVRRRRSGLASDVPGEGS